MVAVRATRAALPHLCVDGGAIVNISSINGVAPDPGIPDYSATKAALNSLGKSIATEYGNRGVRVVSVSPGPTRTAMWLGPAGVAQVVAAKRGVTPEEVVAGAEREIPLGKAGRAGRDRCCRRLPRARRGRRTSAGSTCSSTAA